MYEVDRQAGWLSNRLISSQQHVLASVTIRFIQLGGSDCLYNRSKKSRVRVVPLSSPNPGEMAWVGRRVERPRNFILVFK